MCMFLERQVLSNIQRRAKLDIVFKRVKDGSVPYQVDVAVHSVEAEGENIFIRFAGVVFLLPSSP